jgi:hypothetical protein
VFTGSLPSNRHPTVPRVFLCGNVLIESLPGSEHTVTCLRHAAIVVTQKSVNTLRNNRGSGVFSVPCRDEPSRTVPHSLLCNRQRNNAMTVARISLTQLNYIATVFGGVRAEEIS